MILGIDTSNYTTSLSLYDPNGGVVFNGKKLLSVPEGQKGLRQSDAVFHHVQQLPELFEQSPLGDVPVEAIGVSVRPRDAEDSYMPCFTVGSAFASALGKTLKCEVYPFSHQAGHIAAALYSAGRMDLIREKFLAFHFSGGTTELVLCEPDEETVFRVQMVSHSLDLKAGQIVDRVGLMLGLSFPAGPALDDLACQSKREFRIHPTFRGVDPCLSGVENQCRTMLDQGEAPCDVAAYAIRYLCAVVDRMIVDAKAAYGDLPVICAGGVMGNRMISDAISRKHGACFAQPALSSDNAVGVALLAAYRRNRSV
ncbi:MAG: peptidase M22 [Clostridia bacterium]|nr:peptidase M22 [Clostridia bacterium]